MRFSYDNGRGADTKWLYISFGRGGGYIREWYSNLNQGPGNARSPGNDCGHKGFNHCNSAHCNRAWCNASQWFIFGFLFVSGHTLRIWLGPTYFSWYNLRNNIRLLRQKKRLPHNDGLYNFISFK